MSNGKFYTNFFFLKKIGAHETYSRYLIFINHHESSKTRMENRIHRSGKKIYFQS